MYICCADDLPLIRKNKKWNKTVTTHSYLSGRSGLALACCCPPLPQLGAGSLQKSSSFSTDAKPPSWLKQSWSLAPLSLPDNVLLISPRDRSIWFNWLLSQAPPRCPLLERLSTCLLNSLSAFWSLSMCICMCVCACIWRHEELKKLEGKRRGGESKRENLWSLSHCLNSFSE